MKKRNYAQISVFIILALLIIVVILGVIFFNKTLKKSELQTILTKLEINARADEVQSFIFNCLEDTSRDSLTIIGIQGGYYNKPEKNVDFGLVFIPYYYYLGEIIMPSKEKIEQELADYVDNNLEFCFQELPYEEFIIKLSDSKTTVLIEDKQVNFNTISKISFIKSDFSVEYNLGNYHVIIESELSDIIDLASYITDSHKENSDMICISCVAEIAERKNLYVDMLDFGDENTSLIVISENYTSSEKYVFEFLNKYGE